MMQQVGMIMMVKEDLIKHLSGMDIKIVQEKYMMTIPIQEIIVDLICGTEVISLKMKMELGQ